MAEPRALDTDRWTVDRPLKFFGANVGARVTIVRLRSGGLFVHSPREAR